MNRFINFIMTSLLLFLCCDAFSQEWISLDKSNAGNAVTINTLKSDATTHVAKFSIHGIFDKVIKNQKGEFHKLSIGSNGCLVEVGRPSLPILTQLIAIPEGASISVSIVEAKWKDVNVGKIYPSQKPLTEDEKTNEFYINEGTYSKAFVPQLVKVGKEMEWRGVRNVRLEICPFKYYPEKDLLSVLSDFTLCVSFEEGKVPVEKKLVYETSDPFHLFDNDIFTGNQQENTNNRSTSIPSGKMLIIVSDSLSAIINSEKMKEFRRWKALRGYYTYIVSTATTGNTPASIRNYIKNKYTNNGVRYVLFVGDHGGYIPLKDATSPYNNRTIYSDYWYGCMGGDNDFEADVAVGRFSVSNYYEFACMVDKTIRYEKSYISSNKVLLASHMEDACSYNDSSYQNCSNLIKNANYNESMTFVTAHGASTYCNGDDATNADVISQINQGAHIVNYRGHAAENYWGYKKKQNDTTQVVEGWNYSDEKFWSSEISNMSANTCAVFFCVACHTGNIAGNCMLEAFTRASNGAVAFIGATRESYRSPNHTYDQYLFDKLLNDEVYHVGDVNVSAHIKNMATMGDVTLAQDNALCYLLGGDPTLEIWTAAAQPINNMNIVLNNNTNVFFTVNLSEPYYGAITSESCEHLQNYTYGGNYGVFLKPYFNFFFSLNCHNRFPHISYCNLTSSELFNMVLDYDGYSYVTPLTLRDNEGDGGVVVKSGNKLVIENGTGGVTIQDCFECEKGAVLEIK